MIIIDGSYGEGGGQVLRTSLALSAITGQSVRIEQIRARRRKPGLRPQHLTCVRAAARITNAEVEGAKLDSQALTFVPQSAPKAGTYHFDVAQVAKGGSAGSVSLILQTVLLPLALAGGTSRITLHGGTHVAWSPPFDYLKRVYLPTLAQMGVQAKVNIRKWGWYPIGGGEVRARVEGSLAQAALRGLDLRERGELLRVRGISASSNLPKHIRVRQERAALQTLRSNSVNARIDVIDAPSKGKGTVVFLWATCENAVAGFTSLGELGKPAEHVAEEAAQELVDYVQSNTILDRYLADQLVLPMALSETPSHFTTERVTQHLLTNAWVVNQFLPGRVRVEGGEGQPGACRIPGKES
ncbi:MAG: RNA 3'-terminal phosphate cyclase [Anaerolineae bacterium]|jgi:RNA 3'-terminal phosphate cyclase (ATP)